MVSMQISHDDQWFLRKLRVDKMNLLKMIRPELVSMNRL